MRLSDKWTDYELLDCSDGERLERWGDVILIRPDPQIIWKDSQTAPEWNTAHARYIRSDKGGGAWDYRRKLPESWQIKYRDLTFLVKPTGFKHTGLFPEQAVNWDYCTELIKGANRPINVLNLFAYTGGATLACAAAGASVCHCDAVKGMVEWARTNAKLSGLSDKPIRWIVDDANKFIKREIRRGTRYDGIILDPPSYGRGTNGEMWKLEDSIFGLMQDITELLSDKPLFLLLNSYTTGLSASVMSYLLHMTVGKRFDIDIISEEIGIPVKQTGMPLPCGSTAVVTFR
ncbi:MAG: class I SAM-dependent methyltransferase [Oscillospiraceae bacterium]|nr:class I SAM-dependent methyltransferase [Oscillospiraceae bacterium]